MSTTKDYAFLASQSYEEPDVNKAYRNNNGEMYRAPSGHIYQVLHNASNPATGYQGTIYQDKTTNEIIVAHRGTELQSAKDLQADGQMLRGGNMQIADAMALTQKAQELSNDWKLSHSNQPKPEITVTGHSLGGTLAQVTAYKYGLHGETFNAYGAIGLKGMPANGHSNQMTNHVIATDAVSSAAQHFGQVKVYARQSDLITLKMAGYGTPLPDVPKRLAVVSLGSAHLMAYFTASDGVLNDTQSQSRAHQFKGIIQAYRGDVYHNRDIIKGVFESIDSNAPKPSIQNHHQQNNKNLNFGAAFGLRSDVSEHRTTSTLAHADQTPALDRMVEIMAQTPVFAALNHEEQKAIAMGLMQAAVQPVQTPDAAQSTEVLRMPSNTMSNQISNQTFASVQASSITMNDAPSMPVATNPIVLPPRIAILHEQITEKFGDQLAHLPEKERDAVIAMSTKAAVSSYAKSVDYIYINEQGKVLMGFDNNIGYSNTVNIHDAQKFDASEVLMASVDLQQTQQRDLAMLQAQSQNRSGPSMSMA